MRRNDLEASANRRSSAGNIWIVLIVIGCIIGGLFVTGLIPKLMEKHELADRAEQLGSEKPVVQTVLVAPAPFEESVTLPGNIGAMQYATIYARVDGYLKNRLVDIGDHVKAGSLLAEIDTPTIDEEIEQALADVLQAKAQVKSAQATLKESKAQDETAAAQIERAQADQTYAAVTADRWQNMSSRGAVSIQSRDEKNRALAAQNASLEEAVAQKKAVDQKVAASAAQVEVARANVEAKNAMLAKYKAEQAFKYVLAPFEGVITSRKVDPGALIASGSQMQNNELFQMAKLDILRIYVDVPQGMSRYLHPGLKAQVSVSQYPERTFDGVVTNVAGALDPQTRTRRTEVRVKNPDHVLLPGMYAQIKLSAMRPDDWVRVPSNAVIPHGNDLEVVVVKDGKAHYQKVIVGRDFGELLEIKAGLGNGDVVVVSPPDDLREGDAVKTSDIASK
jgi:RND family efflux transporter MFP subunit